MALDRFKKLVWSDTSTDPFTIDSIARRMLCYDFDYNTINKITKLPIETIATLDELNKMLFSSIQEMCFNLSILIENEETPSLICSGEYPIEALSTILGITPEQWKLFCDDYLSIRK